MTDKIIPVPDSLKHNLTGRKFGRLSVLGYVGRNRFDHAQWLCRCECGNETVKTTSSLVSGRTVACGCYNACLLYTSDAADERSSVDLGGRRSIKKKNTRELVI